jgi:hypothetical protein
VTWEEFLEKLRSHHRLEDLSITDIAPKEEEDEEREIVCHKAVFKAIKDLFYKEREALDGYVDTLSFIFKIRTTNSTRIHLSQIVRVVSSSIGVQTETLEQLLTRVSLAAPKFIVWNEFVQFLTKRGRVVDITRGLLKEHQVFVQEMSLQNFRLIPALDEKENNDPNKRAVDLKKFHKEACQERPFQKICHGKIPKFSEIPLKLY